MHYQAWILPQIVFPHVAVCWSSAADLTIGICAWKGPATMTRIHQMTVGEYWMRYCEPEFVPNHIAWLHPYNTELLDVWRSKISARMFHAEFSDRTTALVSHADIVFVQQVPGTLHNH